MDEKLARKATKLDKQLRFQWATEKKARLEFGKICLEMKREELHRYIRKPGSRKGYQSLWEYIDNVTQGEISRSSTFVFMGIASLTEGPNALSLEAVGAMRLCAL
jgi:hypothetical protein